MFYYCICGKAIEYSLQKPVKCPRCAKSFDTADASIDYDKIRERRAAKENKLRKLREIENNENIDDSEDEEILEIPTDLKKEDVLIEGLIKQKEIRRVTVGDIFTMSQGADIPRGQPQVVSTKEFMEQFGKQNGAFKVVQKSHSVKKGK